MEKEEGIVDMLQEVFIINYPTPLGMLVVNHAESTNLVGIDTFIPLFNTREKAENFISLNSLLGATVQPLPLSYPVSEYGGN